MVRTENSSPNCANICCNTAAEWNKIKSKSALEINNKIKKYLTTLIDRYNIPTVKASRPRSVIEVEPVSPLPAVIPIENTLEIPINATAQKKIAKEIELIEKRITELRQICEITKKKLKMLTENQEIVRYDKVGHPSLLFQHPDLHDQIHTSVESGSADPKRRKEMIKVRIIENLRKNLEERYNIYMAQTILNNYLLPCQANSIAAKAHRHPAWVAVAGVSCTDTQEHPDGHYCLASVKYAKQFASMFSD
ncbi:23264_t:CDS:2, partial [Cetraspora pellucida]